MSDKIIRSRGAGSNVVIDAQDGQIVIPGLNRDYISNTGAELGTEGWESTANITISKETATPLRGSGSLRINVSASATTADYIEYKFTIDEADKNSQLNLIFEHKDGVSYSDDQLEVVIVADPDGTPSELIPSSTQIKTATAVNRFTASFNTTSETSYSLRIKVATASTAMDIIIDSISVGPNNFDVSATGGGGGLSYDSVVYTSNFSIADGEAKMFDTTGGPITITVPNGSVGVNFKLIDVGGAASLNNATVQLADTTEVMTMNVSGAWLLYSWDNTNSKYVFEGPTQAEQLDVYTQTQFLASPMNAVSTGDDILVFNNLTIGRKYEYTGKVRVLVGSDIAIRLMDGATEIAKHQFTTNSESPSGTFVKTFTATSTTLTLEVGGIGGSNNVIEGETTTYGQLKEFIPYSDQTPDVTILDDQVATAEGKKVYSHGTNYNSGNSPTITYAAGGGGIDNIPQSQFIPYQMQDGSWRLKYNFMIYPTSSTRTFFEVTIQGVDPFGGGERMAGNHGAESHALTNSYISTGSNRFHVSHSSATTSPTNGYFFSGDIPLASKPNWAY